MTKKRYRNVAGPQIRAKRIELGWQQSDFAAKLQLAGLTHLDRVLIAKIESNIRSIYDYELAIIARVLGIQITDLLPAEKDIEENLPRLIEQ